MAYISILVFDSCWEVSGSNIISHKTIFTIFTHSYDLIPWNLEAVACPDMIEKLLTWTLNDSTKKQTHKMFAQVSYSYSKFIYCFCNPGSLCDRKTRNIMSIKEELCTNGWADRLFL